MGQTAVITGASSGIGAKCAEIFAKNNYNVVINCLTHEKEAKELSDRLNASGCKTVVVRADVSVQSEAEILKKITFSHFGGVDVLVNNAGIAQQKLFTDITEEEWTRMFDVNVKGAYNCCKAFLPYMINQKYGRIINVSSMWGIRGASCEVHYSASKAALIGFTKALAKEEGPSGITVNCVAPGVIDTPMNNCFSKEDLEGLKEETPVLRLGTPRDVARAILFFASDKSGFITGQVLSVDGGFGV